MFNYNFVYIFLKFPGFFQDIFLFCFFAGLFQAWKSIFSILQVLKVFQVRGNPVKLKTDAGWESNFLAGTDNSL